MVYTKDWLYFNHFFSLCQLNQYFLNHRQDLILEKAHKCIDMGVQALMLNVHASGYGTLGALAEDDNINRCLPIPVIAAPVIWAPIQECLRI
jgi:hypothetical protein